MNIADEFIQNTWYVGAWSHEVNRTPMQRWILGEPVVFYRSAKGTPVAFEDACCHPRVAAVDQDGDR